MTDIIFHVDLDCFFAAVELLDHPELVGVPLIIGADPKKGKGRGVVSTCSYEARDYGVHSGMPISQAYELCPFAVYLRPRFNRIKEISEKVMKILQNYSSIFQQTSIDEAYLDMSNIISNFKQAEKVAFSIKEKVKSEVKVTCSIGVAFSKTLAKIGSDYHKPDGITVITPNNYKDLLQNLPITAIPGIGKKTKIFYYSKGIHTFKDIYKLSLPEISRKLGTSGKWLFNVTHGEDGRKVHDSRNKYDPKSISSERTFREDIDDFSLVMEKIDFMNRKLHKKMKKHSMFYRTISIKIRFQGFITYTRAQSLTSPTCSITTANNIIQELLEEFKHSERKIRLIGIKFSNFMIEKSKNQKKITEFLK
ncbi:DNA polymerase IV [Candidatus Harpocratesius sp.]